jgi:hypothetical protein
MTVIPNSDRLLCKHAFQYARLSVKRYNRRPGKIQRFPVFLISHRANPPNPRIPRRLDAEGRKKSDCRLTTSRHSESAGTRPHYFGQAAHFTR